MIIIVPEIIYFELWRIRSKRVTLKQILFLTKSQASDPRGSCYATAPRRVRSPGNPSAALWCAVVPCHRTKRLLQLEQPPANKLLLGLSGNNHLSKCEYIHTHTLRAHAPGSWAAINRRTSSRQNSCWAGRLSPGPHPDSNAQGGITDLTLRFTQICQEGAQAMVTVTWKAMTSPHLTGPRL